MPTLKALFRLFPVIMQALLFFPFVTFRGCGSAPVTQSGLEFYANADIGLVVIVAAVALAAWPFAEGSPIDRVWWRAGSASIATLGAGIAIFLPYSLVQIGVSRHAAACHLYSGAWIALLGGHLALAWKASKELSSSVARRWPVLLGPASIAGGTFAVVLSAVVLVLRTAQTSGSWSIGTSPDVVAITFLIVYLTCTRVLPFIAAFLVLRSALELAHEGSQNPLRWAGILVFLLSAILPLILSALEVAVLLS